MSRKRQSSRGWLLKDIDPEGSLVRHVGDVAARDGMSVEAWVEHWLGLVLKHHYSAPDPGTRGGTRGQTVAQQAEALRVDMRQNLKILEDNLSRIYQNVERTHEAVERVEGGVHTTEERIHSRKEGAPRRSKDDRN